MKAEIVSIGTELLLGQITDTDSSFLASELPELGVDLYFISQVGDNLNRIHGVLERAWRRSDLILTTGGLGPTEDDLTREAIADFLGEELSLDPALGEWIRDFFQRRGREMSPNNLKQAMVIPSVTPLINERGTAPGWWVEKDGHLLIAMPGPPRELSYMWEAHVKPKLRAKGTGEIIISRNLKTWELGESNLDQMVSPYLHSANPTVGVYAKPDGVHLRITAKAGNEEEARRLIAPVEEGLRAILKDTVWGADDDTLAELTGKMLKARNLTLATMESCTGGLLANAITDVAGSSGYFRGGLVAYNNDMKVNHGVDPHTIEAHGAVSPETAREMAQVARRSLKADVGIGITGVAGPEELEGKPVGTVHIGVSGPSHDKLHTGRYPPPRLDIKGRTVIAALNQLRAYLLSTQ